MRYRAARHRGTPTVPAIIEDIPGRLAKERALCDSHQWGDWQDDQLAGRGRARAGGQEQGDSPAPWLIRGAP
jgi:ParB-like chromosome segregation protein Spo0J